MLFEEALDFCNCDSPSAIFIESAEDLSSDFVSDLVHVE